MVLEEFDQETYENGLRAEGENIGVTKGVTKGITEESVRVITRMLEKGKSHEEIIELLGYSEELIQEVELSISK